MESHFTSHSAGWVVVIGKQLNPRQTKVEDSWQAPSYMPPTMTGATTIEYKHLMVSGCSAIWFVTEWPYKGHGKPRTRTYTLTIHPIHKPVSYTFDGVATSVEDRERMLNEMNAIRDSIKIVGS
jgi:hypothetical protein